MCEPTTIVAGSMMAAGALSNIVAQNNARQVFKGNQNAEKDAVDNQIMENRRRATTDYLRDVRLESLQSDQEHQALSEKSGDIVRQTITDKGTAIASSAERGVGGRSLDMILADFDFQQNNEVGRLRINQQMADAQHKENAGADANEFTARVEAVQPYIPRTPAPVDYFSPIFGLGGGLSQATNLGKETSITKIVGGGSSGVTK